MKRIIAIFILFFMCLFLITPVAASNSLATQTTFHSKLIDALQEIMPQKNVWGLENVTFENLSVGTPVHTYYYVNNELVPGQPLYPITENRQLVLWAIEQDGNIQLSNGLINEVNTAVVSDTEFSLIYDAVATYLYTPQGFYPISEHPNTISGRSVLPSNFSLTEGCIVTTTLSECTRIGFMATRNLPTMVVCNVSRVQQYGANTCWAATIACIYNYLTGATLTEQDVVRIALGDPTIDEGLKPEEILGILPRFDELEYYNGGRAFGPQGSFNDVDIFYSIYADYPVLGAFYNSSNKFDEHASTIYSCNLIAGRMGIMDPFSGSHIATFNSATSTYSYYSTLAGVNYHLYYAFLINE